MDVMTCRGVSQMVRLGFCFLPAAATNVGTCQEYQQQELNEED
jgi:hypothetical protein